MLKAHLYKPFISLQELIEYSSLRVTTTPQAVFLGLLLSQLFCCSCGILCDMVEQMLKLKEDSADV